MKGNATPFFGEESPPLPFCSDRSIRREMKKLLLKNGKSLIKVKISFNLNALFNVWLIYDTTFIPSPALRFSME